MTTIFKDTMDSVTTVNLEAHTPNTGTAYTKTTANQSASISANSGVATFAGGGTPNRIGYQLGLVGGAAGDFVWTTRIQLAVNSVDRIGLWPLRTSLTGSGIALNLQSSFSNVYYFNGTTYTELTNGNGGTGTIGALPVAIFSGQVDLIVTRIGNRFTVQIGASAPFIDFTTNGQVTGTGLLQFEVVSTAGVVSDFQVDVADAAPIFSVHPANQSVTAGSTATFGPVSASGAPTWQWQRNAGGAGSWVDISGATADTYTTPATTVSGGSANNTDQYRVVATNASGTTNSNAATLSVSAGNVAPQFTQNPANQTVTEGATATFGPVTVTGSPTPTLQWQRSTDGGSNWNNISGATNASYTTPGTSVTGGSANNSDRYRCVATNAAGTVNSTAGILTVNAAATGVVTSLPFKNESNGNPLVGITVPFVKVIPIGNPSGAIDFTNLVTNGQGRLVIANAGITAGQKYMLVTWSADGLAAGIQVYAAT